MLFFIFLAELARFPLLSFLGNSYISLFSYIIFLKRSVASIIARTRLIFTWGQFPCRARSFTSFEVNKLGVGVSDSGWFSCQIVHQFGCATGGHGGRSWQLFVRYSIVFFFLLMLYWIAFRISAKMRKNIKRVPH